LNLEEAFLVNKLLLRLLLLDDGKGYGKKLNKK
jgi:hypothetical protein